MQTPFPLHHPLQIKSLRHDPPPPLSSPTMSRSTLPPIMAQHFFLGFSTLKTPHSLTILHRLPRVRRYAHHPIDKTHSHLKVSSSSSSSSSSTSKLGLIAWYLRKLQNHPVLTKSITTSIIFAASDLTSQMITLAPSASFDLKRTSRMAIYGLLILGPSQHMWFNFLSKILPKTDVVTTLKKIFLGQVVFGPIINTIFFSYNGAVQGESGSEIIARLKRDLLPTLLSGALFWPPCDFVTFKFVPIHLQPLLNSSCAYVWTIYLTYMANRQNLSSA